MKQRMKRICALLMCGCMFMTSGCGIQKNPSGSTKQADGMDSGLKTIKVGYSRDTSFEYQGDETAENNAWVNMYRENGIGLDVLFEIDSSQYREKMAQSVMADDYPDFMNVDAQQFSEWANQGVFADLTEGFEKYASDEVKEIYNSEEGQRALKAATVDGKLYGLPGVPSPHDNMPILVIRKDWLDNLGMEIPKTVDEFYQVAKAFSENDPDQNGKDDTYGFALNGKDVFQQFGDCGAFFEMFGAQPGSFTNVIPFIDIDGKAQFGGAKSEEMKEGLTMLQKMYDEGIISKDFVTAGQDQIIQELSSGKVGLYFGIFYSAELPWRNALETQPEAEFVTAPIPGITGEECGQSFYSATPSSFIAMSSKYEDMETFFDVVNLGTHYGGRPDKITQEEYEMYNGKAGEYTGYSLSVGHLALPSKNMKAYDVLQEGLKTGDTSEMNPENKRDFTAMMKYVENQDRRSELTEDELASFNAGLLYWSVWGNENCSYESLHKTDEMDHYLYSAYDTAPTNKMNECSATLITLTKETIMDIITGNESVDYYDEFLNQWNKLGGEEITKEADEWYQQSK